MCDYLLIYVYKCFSNINFIGLRVKGLLLVDYMESPLSRLLKFDALMYSCKATLIVSAFLLQEGRTVAENKITEKMKMKMREIMEGGAYIDPYQYLLSQQNYAS